MDQELVQYLDERFHGLVHGLDQRFEGIARRFDEVNERLEEVKRHSGVLAEGLHREVRLVAESLAVHIEAEGVRHQAIQEQFRETRALVHLSYEQLHQRVESLERRGQP
jgi:hypothetical protein